MHGSELINISYYPYFRISRFRTPLRTIGYPDIGYISDIRYRISDIRISDIGYPDIRMDRISDISDFFYFFYTHSKNRGTLKINYGVSQVSLICQILKFNFRTSDFRLHYSGRFHLIGARQENVTARAAMVPTHGECWFLFFFNKYIIIFFFFFHLII